MSLEFLKEAIQEVTARNSSYCNDKINEITRLLSKHRTHVLDNPLQDESLFVYIYYRKGNDMESHGASCVISGIYNNIDEALAEKAFKGLLINGSATEL